MDWIKPCVTWCEIGVDPALRRRLHWMTFQALFQPERSYDSKEWDGLSQTEEPREVFYKLIFKGALIDLSY